MKKEKEKNNVSGPMIYLAIPDPFLDSDEREWTLTRRNGVQDVLGLQDVLLHTLRRCPVETGLDAMRVLDIREAVKHCVSGYIALGENDWLWMIEHFKLHAHLVWLAPEAAYLVRYLNCNSATSIPSI